MADDELTGERQALLDEVEECNELLARLGVPTGLPMSLAKTLTTAELGRAQLANRRRYLEKRQQLDGLV